jgi:hypothetical protein
MVATHTDWHRSYMAAWNDLRAAVGSAPLTPQQQKEVLTPLTEAIAATNAGIARYECASIGTATQAQTSTQQRGAGRRNRQAGNAGQSPDSTNALSGFQQKCIAALNRSDGLTAAQIAEKIGSKAMTVGRAINSLAKKRAGPITKRGELFYLGGGEVRELRTGTGG